MRSLGLVVAFTMTACSGDEEMAMPVGDAGAPDANLTDARPDFFGEACELPNIPMYPGAVDTCHDGRGFCIDEDKNGDFTGTCRAWCDVVGTFNATYTCLGARHGGIPTWTSDGTTTDKPFVCYCAPPR